MHVVTVHDPFHPLRGREVREVRNRRRLAKLAPKTDRPFIMMVDGVPVLRKDWDQSVGGDQIVIVMMLPQGGGSSPLRIIGMLAVVAAAFIVGPIVGGFIGGALGIGAAAASAIGSGLIMAGGSMLVNAIAPPPSLANSSLANAASGSIASPSPTYNLQAQGNVARLGQAIPVQYGRLRVFPDYASQPYVEYADNEQYLYQLLMIGQGEYSVEAVQIGDSATTSFQNVTYEIVQPGALPTLFPANVSTSSDVSGQELLTSTPVGPFVTNNPGTKCNSIGIDVVCPRGLYYANNNGGLDARSASFQVEARPVDQSGNPTGTGAWTTLYADSQYTSWSSWVYYAPYAGTLPADTNTEHYQFSYNYNLGPIILRQTRSLVTSSVITITAATTTPIRKSYRYDVSALGSGMTYPRFQVRVTRTDSKDTDSRAGNEIDWTGMRAYMPATTTYGQVTLLAIKAQATNNLSSTSARQVNVICTRKLKTVTASGLSSTVTATRSLAAALADIAMNTVYGGGMASANIDWAQLYALDQALTTRGDYLDVRFDNSTTLWDALTQAGIVARTKPFMQGGVLHFMRDAAATVPVALFSMRNIIQNSMSINYLTPTSETADYTQVTYFDANTWQQTTVDCVLSGGTSNTPAKLAMMGVTSRAQAFREGLYQAAANKYRRKVIKFSTEAEGFIPSFGDLIAIQHDIPAWGQVGEVTSWDSSSKTLTVNETLTWTAGATHYVGIRKRDGSIDGPFVATQGAAANILVLATSPSFTPYTGLDEERTHIAFGPGDTWRQPARVVAVQPRGPYQVEITAVNEDPSVHTADVGQTAPALSYSQLAKTPKLPIVTGLAVTVDVTGATPQYVAAWTAAPGADHYLVQVSWDGGASWTQVATEYGTSHRWQANRNATATVRVAGVNFGVGAWSTATVNYSAAPAAPTGFTGTIAADSMVLSWNPNVELDVVAYEIRSSDSGWGNLGALFSGNAVSATITPPASGSATTYYLRAIDFLGNYSATSATLTYTVAAPSVVQGVLAAVNGQQVQVSWSKPASIITTQLSVAQFEVRTADSGWGTASGYLFRGQALSFLTAPPAAGSSTTYYVRAIDVRGNYSSTSASTSFSASSVPNIASFAAGFSTSSTTVSTVTLSWTDVAPQFGLGGYQISYASTTVTVKANNVVIPIDWTGDRLFTIKTVDALGNVSSGYSATVTKLSPNSPSNFRAQVIDNTVMLYWLQPAATSLPISHYLLRRGSSWASYDVDFGRKDGLFTAINETSGGTYTYWIVAVDTDGVQSAAVSVSAIVAQPPDFTFFGQFISTFSGTKSSAFLEGTTLVLPVNTSETYAAHFTARSWASPSDQINAGYPVYIQPSNSPGYYEEQFDFGTILASSRVSVAYTATVIAGSPVTSCTISTSSDGTTWLTNTGTTQIFATTFRYVKIRVTVTDSAGTGIVSLSGLTVTLDAKLKNDAGMTACVSSDTSGTIANFNVEFVDVQSITVTPQSTTPITAVYDFLDSVITGTYSVTSNVATISATAHGLVAGQKVRLSFTTGSAPSGVYTVASVTNANTYTVAITTANTSGNVSTYSQGLRIYLFNSSGTRVSGTASWSIKGY